jgi:hypothetical protein
MPSIETSDFGVLQQMAAHAVSLPLSLVRLQRWAWDFTAIRRFRSASRSEFSSVFQEMFDWVIKILLGQTRLTPYWVIMVVISDRITSAKKSKTHLNDHGI